MNAMSSPAASTTTAVSAAGSALRQLLSAAALGVVVLYAVGFATSPLAHNAAHDVRHIAATPCH